jgi:hypothetical protein
VSGGRESSGAADGLGDRELEALAQRVVELLAEGSVPDDLRRHGAGGADVRRESGLGARARGRARRDPRRRRLLRTVALPRRSGGRGDGAPPRVCDVAGVEAAPAAAPRFLAWGEAAAAARRMRAA